MAVSPQYAYAQNTTLTEVATQRARAIDPNTAGGLLLPLTTEDAANVEWEFEDDVTGLAALRGPGEDYLAIQSVGSNRFGVRPARFGEKIVMDEQWIEDRRQLGTIGTPINIAERQLRDLEILQTRSFQRIEQMRWSLLSTGQILAQNQADQLVPVAQYNQLTFTPAVPWTTVATATPVNDLRAVRDQIGGSDFHFDSRAIAYANPVTWNQLWRNTNVNDFGGLRQFGLSPVNGIDAANVILQQYDLPKLMSVNDNFKTTQEAFTRYIPEGVVIVVGWSWAYGTQVGDFPLTRNANNPEGAPGIFAETQIPRDADLKLPVTRYGWNGNVRLRYRRQVVRINAYTP